MSVVVRTLTIYKSSFVVCIPERESLSYLHDDGLQHKWIQLNKLGVKSKN